MMYILVPSDLNAIADGVTVSVATEKLSTKEAVETLKAVLKVYSLISSPG